MKYIVCGVGETVQSLLLIIENYLLCLWTWAKKSPSDISIHYNICIYIFMNKHAIYEYNSEICDNLLEIVQMLS